MQQLTETFAKRIDEEVEMLHKEVLQSFALSAKAKKTGEGVSEKKGKEVQKVILAIDVEWKVRFKELAEQVAKLSKARCLDAESIADVKTRIASHPSTALPVRETVGEPGSPALFTSPLPSSGRVRDVSPSPSPETNDEKSRQIPLADGNVMTSQSILKITGVSWKVGRRYGTPVSLTAKLFW
jgi:hypothetical protein